MRLLGAAHVRNEADIVEAFVRRTTGARATAEASGEP
jgi:hypothetical protein